MEAQSEPRRSRRGDRKDGWLIRDADTMHLFMPYLMPNRADNEAVLNETVELDAINRYLEQKNASQPDFKYTFFHVICAALAKTIILRPKMNRFYAGHRLYERKVITFSFVVKKKFEDSSEEALAIITVDPDSEKSPLDQIHDQVEDIVTKVRKKKQTDGTTDKMGKLLHLPRPILRFVMAVLRWLDYHGWYPTSFMKDDPYYTSVFVTNLGSIKMNADYHHLANWGTNSFFAVVGEKKLSPVFDETGHCEMRETLNLGMTLDERIADGFYYAGSVKILKKLLAEPALLDQPPREQPAF